MSNDYSFELVDNGKYFTDYLNVSGEGWAAIVENKRGGAAVIFTDRKNAGGVAPAPFEDGDWANLLAHYWVRKAKEGYRAEDVFDTLVYEFGDEVMRFSNLAKDLSTALGNGYYSEE
ncbi:hypothetical protein [Corynebacterium sp.]|uniref:hypothetical protein n=1 Tax=Corynebacterium sp. TaxID=1720 RepID=UPI002A919EC5|nr:hypothetical protein [Corynebacterium sp.]MDY5786193.1 hypothetical protein [Corynebacterium sp.]